MQTNKEKITIECTVQKPIETVWKSWTEPQHITKWSFASPDWHTPTAENDLKIGGKFLLRMEAKDGSMGFDFWGIYDDIKKNESIEYTMGDGRKAWINFSTSNNETKVTETFEAESENPLEMQQMGWQAILNNFKTYTESLG